MLEEQLSSQVVNIKAYKTEIAKKYTTFLSQYPEIFSDLCDGSDFDFCIYDCLDSYYDHSPIDVFNVLRNGKGIEIIPGKAKDSDLELALSVEAITKLIQTNSKEEYAQLLGSFYNDPDEKEGWIDFELFKRTQNLIDMGYGRFAKTAGILEDEDDVYSM
jgi:hypothetical protein